MGGWSLSVRYWPYCKKIIKSVSENFHLAAKLKYYFQFGFICDFGISFLPFE